jgi:butyryl-CoA dehydrogenase
LLELLTPVAKSFPAEWGFESNALALQIHGGYGYSSEYLPEAWLRDQKLNSLHEGTTGIQGLDLLGRRVMANGGASLGLLVEEITRALVEARAVGFDGALLDEVAALLAETTTVTAALGAKGAGGDVGAMLRHSTDYLAAFGILTIGWQHVSLATAALIGLGKQPDDAFLRGKVASATYFLRTEIPRAKTSLALVRSGEDSFERVRVDEL